MEDDREQRIRARANHLWEVDGKPHGREAEYLERARELIAIEENPTAGQLPNPMSKGLPAFEQPVEEAEIQENLGEFPDRNTDQGDHQHSPSVRHKKP